MSRRTTLEKPLSNLCSCLLDVKSERRFKGREKINAEIIRGTDVEKECMKNVPEGTNKHLEGGMKKSDVVSYPSYTRPPV